MRRLIGEAQDLLEHDVVQIVNHDLLLQSNKPLCVLYLRLLEQQLVSFDRVLL